MSIAICVEVIKLGNIYNYTSYNNNNNPLLWNFTWGEDCTQGCNYVGDRSCMFIPIRIFICIGSAVEIVDTNKQFKGLFVQD